MTFHALSLPAVIDEFCSTLGMDPPDDDGFISVDTAEWRALMMFVFKRQVRAGYPQEHRCFVAETRSFTDVEDERFLVRISARSEGHPTNK